jgi:rubrerythrin
MGEVRTIRQVLELAAVREVQALEFYAALAQRVDDPATRSVLEQLAGQELEHKAKIEMEIMKAGLIAKSVDELPGVGEPEYASDLTLETDASVADALRVAIRKERLAFRFFVGLAATVPGAEVYDVLLELAEEEARHLVMLEIEHNRLVARGK